MVRTLSLVEETLYRFDRAIAPRGVCYAFFVSSKEPLTKEKLENAMDVLVNRHPLLRMCICNINNKLTWKPMNSNKSTIYVNTREDVETIISNSLDLEFDLENGPLWSLTLVPDVKSEFQERRFRHHQALVFHSSHTIIDGLGRLCIDVIARLN